MSEDVQQLKVTSLLNRILDTANINAAYDWLCQRRKEYSANSDVWDFRFRWSRERQALVESLSNGNYRFSPVTLYAVEGEVRCVWCAADALVLRAIAQVLPAFLGIHSTCLHIKGQGGVHEGVRWAQREYSQHTLHLRSDVKGYYRHIRHGVLMQQLRGQIRDRKLLNLIQRYLRRVETCGGVYCEKNQGLNKGDPLAPVLAALYLKPLDQALSELGAYVRFMDDWLFLTNSRAALREAIRRMHRILQRLGMRIHPDKTSMGKTARGFDWLGFRFLPNQVRIIPDRLIIIINKYRLLFEQSVARAQKYLDGVTCWLRGVLTQPDALISAMAADEGT